MEITNKVIVITGGASGIGRAMAERQHLRHHLHAQDTSVQRDEVFTDHATDGD